MKSFIVTLVLMIFIMSGLLQSADFEVTQVIEIGPCSGPVYRPVQWSPDGSRIAFFSGKTLMIADTLGNTKEIYEIAFHARKFLWANNEEIVLAQTERGRPYRLSLINLSGEENVLAEERSQKPQFSGPHSTPDNIVYYYPDKNSKSEPIILSHLEKNQQVLLSEHYQIKLLDSTLYKISLNEEDTVELINKKISSIVTSESFDKIVYTVRTGEVYQYQFSNNELIKIELPNFQVPETANYCLIEDYNFNTNSDLLLYYVTCDSHYNVENSIICLFDNNSRTNYLFSPMTTSSFESQPVFSPNNRYFSFIAGGIGVCIAKLEK
ncbi:MAG: hypothetical protein U9N54_09810 [candidate division Zixibacteria bacterium]|nr:hypothetical protein [candidate division Zixibacteria bacterium]